MPTTETGDLLRRASEGSPGAWAELVRRHGPMLRARAAGFRLQEADAHDAIQVTWLRLAENVHRIRTPEHLGGWLATVVTRECLRVVRERGRLVLDEDAGESDAAPDRGPEELAVFGRWRVQLRQARGARTPPGPRADGLTELPASPLSARCRCRRRSEGRGMPVARSRQRCSPEALATSHPR